MTCNLSYLKEMKLAETHVASQAHFVVRYGCAIAAPLTRSASNLDFSFTVK